MLEALINIILIDIVNIINTFILRNIFNSFITFTKNTITSIFLFSSISNSIPKVNFNLTIISIFNLKAITLFSTPSIILFFITKVILLT